MILCLMEIMEEESETPTKDDSAEWVEAVNQTTYFLFVAMGDGV